jgi:hypothetical protein
MQARRQEQVSVLQYERDGLRASRERHMAAYSKLVEARDDLAHLALEPVRALDDQIAVIEQTIAEAEAEKEGQKATFSSPDEAAAVYAELQALAAGRIAKAKGARAVNEALRDVLACAWLDYDPVTEHLTGEFRLRAVSKREPVQRSGQTLVYRCIAGPARRAAAARLAVAGGVTRPARQNVTTRSLSANRFATSGGVTQAPLSLRSSASVAPRATAQPFQTKTGTSCSRSFAISSRSGGTPTPSTRAAASPSNSSVASPPSTIDTCWPTSTEPLAAR